MEELHQKKIREQKLKQNQQRVWQRLADAEAEAARREWERKMVAQEQERKRLAEIAERDEIVVHEAKKIQEREANRLAEKLERLRIWKEAEARRLEDSDLPSGWEGCRTPNGRKYYINHNTKTTQWDKPGASTPTTSTSNAMTTSNNGQPRVSTFDKVVAPIVEPVLLGRVLWEIFRPWYVLQVD